MFSARRFFTILAAIFLVTLSLTAATVTSLIPSTATHGARAVVIGSGLDATGVTVSFSDASLNAVPATIVSRSTNVLEIIVPSAAATGTVHVTNGSAAIGSLAFTLAPDVTFANVATLAASDKAHDVFKQPSAVAVAIPSGTVFVADRQHHQVAILQPNGKVSLVVGTGHPGLADGAASKAELKEPQGIVVDSTRQLVYIADTGNNAIRRMTFDGTVSTLATGDTFKQPTGLAIDGAGNVYVADTGNSAIRRITPDGAVTTIAGGVHDGLANGAASEALFNHPEGAAVSADGAVYVSDTQNNVIRKIANGIVSTIAGTGHGGFVDGAATLAEFKHPSGITLDDAGNLFVADAGNDAIRKIETQTAVVSTIAGAGKPGNTDGALASAQFKQPTGIAYSGILLITDTHNDALRILTTAPRVTAIYPTRGPLSGGNTVRIFGDSFVPGATSVAFGGVAATEVTFVTATELLVKVPPASAGTVDVAVTTPFGTDTLANGYSYVPPPTISSVAPAKGMTAGGQTLTIIGTNYIDGDTTVTIGGAPATVVQFVSPATITVRTPPGNAGPADVVVTTPGGAATLTGGFTYFAPPVITSFSPAKGFAGTVVTITGQNFDPDVTGDQLLLGTTTVTITSATPTQIVFTVPNGASTGKITLTTAGGSAQSASDFVVPFLTSIAVAPASTTIIEGQTQAFMATGTYSDGETKDLTMTATWSSSDRTLATVDATGLVTAVHYGTASITATVGSIHGSATLTIQPRLVALAIAPQNPTVKQGTTQAFTVTASYSDGSTKDATKLAQWSVSDATLANVDASGNVTTTKYGTVTVTAKLDPLTASTQLTILPIATKVVVQPATLTVNHHGTGQLTATATYSDGSTKDATSVATWSSSAPTFATVAAGTITGVAPGTATITAMVDAASGSATVTVVPVLTGINVSPTTLTINHHATGQVRATAAWSDGTTSDAAASATWASSATSVATVSAGTVTGVFPGMATISATLGGFSASASVTVLAIPTALTVTPANLTINQGSTGSLVATVTYSDNSTKDETATATWTTSNASFATVKAGAVTAVAPGTATITAAAEGFTASSTVKVVAVLQTIHLSTTPTSILKGQTLQITASGLYSDGTTADLTSTATWTTSQPTIATVSGGLVTAVGPGTATITAASGGVSASSTVTVVAQSTTLTSIDVTPSVLGLTTGNTRQLSAAAHYSDGSTTDVTSSVTWTSGNPAIANVSAGGLLTATGAGNASVTAVLNSGQGANQGSALVEVGAPVSPPPDPATVATPLDRTIVSTLADEIRFLYSGPNAIQTGVAAGVIDDDRATVFRGRLTGSDGTPLPAVIVTVLNHPEYGQTISRADGMYDLVINGGGSLTLAYRKIGYISAQRLVSSRWAEQDSVDEVVLLPFDAKATFVSANAANLQVVRGSVTNDDRGRRQATLLFPAGTTATLLMPNGSSASAPTLNVRATEFTVGPTGPNAAPASLPTSSMYSYCVELSADEAEIAGASSVSFSNPVSVYIENFLDIPVGTAVFSSSYARAKGKWMGRDGGLVLKVLSSTGGLADLDLDGSGTAANATSLASFGITDAERQELAILYTPGQSLWRIVTSHFTPFNIQYSMCPGAQSVQDLLVKGCGLWPPGSVNWFGGPADALAPHVSRPMSSRKVCDTCTANGSIIDIHNQGLGESIPITGTPYSLDYSSLNTRKLVYTMNIQLSGATVPSSLLDIGLNIDIAGQHFQFGFPAQPNLSYQFDWNGLDVYGRRVQGGRAATVTISYDYPSVPPQHNLLFTMKETFIVSMGQLDAEPVGFGGWTFSPQRFFDGRGRVVYESGGAIRASDPQETNTLGISSAAGNGQCCLTGLGGFASQASLNYPIFMSFAPDGTYYFTDGWFIQKVDPSGIISNVAGQIGPYGNETPGFTPDGTPALGQPINGFNIAVSPDGVLYFSDNYRIRALINGAWVTIAGTGVQYDSSKTLAENGWGGPAISANLGSIEGMAIGPDGRVYLSDNGTITRVEPDGRLVVIAGNVTGKPPIYPYGTEDVPALGSQILAFTLAVGQDGSVYFTDDGTTAWRITPDGILHLLAGSLTATNLVQSGQPATSGYLNAPWGITIAPDGSVLVAEYGPSSASGSGRVMRVTQDGIITVLAGNGEATPRTLTAANGTLARGTALSIPWDVQVAPDGSVYFVDFSFNTIRRLDKIFPAASNRVPIRVIASDDGSTADIFDHGRHTKTVDTLTSATLQTLGYDANGFVNSVTDESGNVTTIQRDGSGVPTAIIAPGGQKTTLTVSNNQLTAISDPAGQTFAFGYNSAGLLGSLTDPRGSTHSFTYDANNLLLKDTDPAGGFTQLARTGSDDAFTVQKTTAEGRTSSYNMTTMMTGDVIRTKTGEDGLVTNTAQGGNGTSTVTYPDGTSVQTTLAADPRFGMMSPMMTGTTVTSGSHTLSIRHSRSVTLSDSQNPFSLTSITDSVTQNGTTWTSTYTAANQTLTTTSPTGRVATATLDAKGRPISIAEAGITPLALSYNSLGEITSSQQGSRKTSFSYDSRMRLASVTDPLNRIIRFAYDDADRMTTETLPDGRVVGFTYDANGNVKSVMPPGRSQHSLTFTPVDQVASYVPPAVPGASSATYTYNNEHQLTLVTRPDAKTLAFGYDNAGRLATLTTSLGTVSYAYDQTTGQPTTIMAPDGTSVSLTYDGSLLTTASSTGPVGGTIGYSYDGSWREASESVNGTAIKFGYDGDDLLTSAGDLTLTRDPSNGLVTGTTLGSVSDSVTYDPYGDPSTYAATAAGNAIFSESVVRDDAGRITKKTETYFGITTTTSYIYDVSGRLVSATTPVGTTTYTYDDNGNRLTRTTGATTESASYDAQDRLLTYGGATYTYTGNGELQSKTDVTGTTTYSYDVLGNLRHVVLANGATIDYVIDAANRRTGKQVNGILVKGWLYSGNRIVAETDGPGMVTTRFVYATRSNVPDYMVRGGNTYRILADHLGSPRALVDTATGVLAWNNTYDEFGRPVPGTPEVIPFGFAGGLFDADTGLVRFGARDYDPQLGRWTARDPLYFGGADVNLYAYSANDPVNSVDPSGLGGKDVTQMSCPELIQKMIMHMAELAKLLNNERQLQLQDKGREGYQGHKTKWESHMNGLRNAYQEWSRRCRDDDDPNDRKLASKASRWLDEAYPDPLPEPTSTSNVARSYGAAAVLSLLFDELVTVFAPEARVMTVPGAVTPMISRSSTDPQCPFSTCA